ncbi:hypothetical protein [Chondromyces apiculatus]|uniref:Kazal-like domain-containing protein n=1 Tax=Chondromyces apiculatus DSM 436 TaxID=1192034 RepID=A0A017T0X9_9BACT|nr:hypothetical protein [Chondromyces apiculatus]EYF02211.1 Hypothetical protein CAP_7354 [Chondromyces apiculatus DSM 436]
MNVRFVLTLALAAASLAGCQVTTSSEPPVSATPSTPSTPTETAPAPPPPADTPPPPPEPTASETPAEPPPKNPEAGGRLAFTTCTPESRQVKGCTRDYKPVCGQVDTGIRCIKAPCPSADPKTFPNACTACQEPKTTGYFPMSCEDIKKPGAP